MAQDPRRTYADYEAVVDDLLVLQANLRGERGRRAYDAARGRTRTDVGLPSAASVAPILHRMSIVRGELATADAEALPATNGGAVGGQPAEPVSVEPVAVEPAGPSIEPASAEPIAPEPGSVQPTIVSEPARPAAEAGSGAEGDGRPDDGSLAAILARVEELRRGLEDVIVRIDETSEALSDAGHARPAP